MECVKSKHINYNKNNFDISDDDIDKLVVYEYSKPVENIGVNEYLDYVTTNKYNNSQ